MFGVWGFGGLGSGVLGLSFGVRDSCLGGVVGVAELRGHVEEKILVVRHLVCGERFGVQGLGFRVLSLGSRVWGLGFGVEG